MNITLTINDKTIERDEFLNEDEMELPPFQFALVELSQYVNGDLTLSFGNQKSVKLDLFDDFMACFADILDSITALKLRTSKKEVIWFCEQGSDFYLYYEVKGELTTLSYIQGNSVGKANKLTPDFSLESDTEEYLNQWESVFQELTLIMKQKLNRKVSSPLDAAGIVD